MALQSTDLLLINRSSTTYTTTLGVIEDHILGDIKDGSSPLTLGDLKDVDDSTNGNHADQTFFANLSGGPGNLTSHNFHTAVTAEIDLYFGSGGGAIKIESVFDIADVVDSRSNPGDAADYNGKFLLGNGTSQFEARPFDDQVKALLTQTNLTDILSTSDLSDTDVSGYTDGDFLYFDKNKKKLVNKPFASSVTNILTTGKDPNGDDITINIPTDKLPIGEHEDGSSSTDNRGIVSVIAADTSRTSYLTVTDGVLDIVSNIPDIFIFKGTFDYAADGTVSNINPAVGTFARGDMYIAIAANPGGNVTLSGGSPFDGLTVSDGSMCVYNGSTWVVIGAIDSNIAAQDLQNVLETGNSATDLGISLEGDGTAADIAITGGLGGSFTTTKGEIATDDGDITTTKGDIVIGTSGTQDATEGKLSVPNIDFTRFNDISTAP